VKKLFNWILVLAACVGAFYMIGWIVPRNQSVTSKTTLLEGQTKIFALVADVRGWPAWAPNVSAAHERPERDGIPIWRLTDASGRIFDLEVNESEEPKLWQASYTLEGTTFTMRIDLSGYGQGTHIRVAKRTSTPDPWIRAQHFLLPSHDWKPLAWLNAMAEHFGETATVETK
jgi:hypothetical protein